MTSDETRIEGLGASSGVAVGRAFVFGDILDEVEPKKIDRSQVDSEYLRFLEAVELVKQELEHDAEHISDKLGQDKADVFLVHSMILEDSQVLDGVRERISNHLLSAEAAVAEELKRFSRVLAESKDAYLRDRSDDISDIGRRVLERMLGVWAHCPLASPMIVVAREFRASDTVSMDRHRILGFATEFGGKQTHAAIIARSMDVPAVVGARGLLDVVNTGDTIVMDGDEGVVIVNPTPAVVERYEERKRKLEHEKARLTGIIDLPPMTLDGVRVSLLVNIGTVDEAEEAVRIRADGVGLLRTEIPFLSGGMFLGEEEQYELYRSIAVAMEGRPVVIRTLDIGGDKFIGPENPLREHNPYLGYRSTRLLLGRREIFTEQMTAILRSGVHGDVRMMWPMISSVEELRSAKAVLAETISSLRERGDEFRENMPVGVMVEIPSAAIMADRLAAECDFLSIGTNDLIQYVLAVDRGNALVDALYTPLSPAVISLIARTVEAGKASGKPVTLCGEMGGRPEYVPLLIGLGLRELSMTTSRLLAAKRAVRLTDSKVAALVAERSVSASTVEEVELLLASAFGDAG